MPSFIFSKAVQLAEMKCFVGRFWLLVLMFDTNSLNHLFLHINTVKYNFTHILAIITPLSSLLSRTSHTQLSYFSVATQLMITVKVALH